MHYQLGSVLGSRAGLFISCEGRGLEWWVRWARDCEARGSKHTPGDYLCGVHAWENMRQDHETQRGQFHVQHRVQGWSERDDNTIMKKSDKPVVKKVPRRSCATGAAVVEHWNSSMASSSEIVGKHDPAGMNTTRIVVKRQQERWQTAKRWQGSKWQSW